METEDAYKKALHTFGRLLVSLPIVRTGNVASQFFAEKEISPMTPRATRKPPALTVTVRMTPETRDLLDRLAEQLGTTLGETTHRALEALARELEGGTTEDF